VWNVCELPMTRERRKAERYATASIPIQISDIDGELIDLSLYGAAVVHRSPIKAGTPCTMIFPSYGGIYVPCQVLRSIVQVRRGRRGPEYIFRSAITFLPMAESEQGPLHEFLAIQIRRLKQVEQASA
jgi:PilZ domain